MIICCVTMLLPNAFDQTACLCISLYSTLMCSCKCCVFLCTFIYVCGVWGGNGWWLDRYSVRSYRFVQNFSNILFRCLYLSVRTVATLYVRCRYGLFYLQVFLLFEGWKYAVNALFASQCKLSKNLEKNALHVQNK